MLYELQVLRNGNPEVNRSAAIQVLDTFEHHLIGQPCSIRYYADESKETVRLLFAVGKRSYIAEPDLYQSDPHNNYEIINDYEDSTLYWETFEEKTNELIGTDDRVHIVFTDMDQFEAEKQVGVLSPDQIIFVSDKETGANKIYLGDQVFSTNSLVDLIVGDEIVIGETTIEPGGSIYDIINALQEFSQNVDLLWNDDNLLKFKHLTNSDYKAQVDNDINNGHRDFYEVDMSQVMEGAPNGYRVGKNLVGDLYLTKVDANQKMVLNVGDFHYDSKPEDVRNLSKMSINEVIDRILFPKNPLTNYAIITKKEIDDLFDKYWHYDPEHPDIPEGGETGHRTISHDEIDEIVAGLDLGLYYDKDKSETVTPEDVPVYKINKIVVDEEINDEEP